MLEKLKEFIVIIYHEFGGWGGGGPKTLRSDNGCEYVNRQIKDFLMINGMKHSLTMSHCPSQNGVAERKNRILVEMTRMMLSEPNVPQKF